MRIIVAGGRDFRPTTNDWYMLRDLLIANGCTEVVSGGCSGADKVGEVVAQRLNIAIKTFPADWNKHGRSAGPIRNKQMAEYADAVILLPGGRGTDSMRNEAKSAGIKILYDAGDRF